ncbi:GDP-L-fucose synthase [Candidatus Parcubacteria bacterium]|jgi:GDP-L-fucose synthase|nr:MAG: GDP-L-fucose synthase [Candidatus Parcubacteria bacterium]
MDRNAKIFVAGHRGLVGSALVRKLELDGYKNLLLKNRAELDLLDFHKVHHFFEKEKPEYVLLAAAKVGGIFANNTLGADFIYENLTIQNNVVKSAHDTGVSKLLFLGSSCIYPRNCPQPMKEEYFLSGKPEPTNTPYAAAKIAGILMCQAFHKQYNDNFISVMPTNLYGPNDNFDLKTSHVFPALIRKFYEAKLNSEPTVTVWGTGAPKREFMHVDDLASACVFLMKSYDSPEIINIGTGVDVSIKDFAEMVKETVGYNGEIVWDTSKPDGTPQKLLDVSKINALGWNASIDLSTGIKKTYEWYTAKTR